MNFRNIDRSSGWNISLRFKVFKQEQNRLGFATHLTERGQTSKAYV